MVIARGGGVVVMARWSSVLDIISSKWVVSGGIKLLWGNQEEQESRRGGMRASFVAPTATTCQRGTQAGRRITGASLDVITCEGNRAP